MRKRWWIAIAAVVVLGTGSVGYAMMKGNQPAGTPVRTASVVQAGMENQVLTTGKVKAKDEVTLYSAGSGILYELSVKQGDTVQKGQTIGKIDTSEVESQLHQLDAQIAEQQAKLAEAKMGLAPEEKAQLETKIYQQQLRYESALKDYQDAFLQYNSDKITEEELRQKESEVKTQEAQLNADKQDLAIKQQGPRREELAVIEAGIQKLESDKRDAAKEQEQSQLTAPLDGTVTGLKAEKGQSLTKGGEVLTIANLDQFEIVSQISQSDVKKIQVGQDALIESPTLGKQKLKAHVTKIAPTAVTKQEDQNQQITVDVTLELDERSDLLKSGFQVDVRIVSQQSSNALQVPFDAIQQNGDGTSFVWLIDAGKAKKQNIETGIENELFVEVKSGLAKDQKVIVTPPETLKENDAVMENANPVPNGN